MCVMCRIILGTYCLSVCKWLGGLPVVFYAFSLWSAAVLRLLGVRCFRIGFPFVGAIEVILTLYVAIIHC